jgi:Domain of unknown function (DUF2017)
VNVSAKRGRLRVHLDPVEVDVLTTLLGELDTAVRDTDLDDPVVARLYPSAHPDDESAAVAYRELTESGLRDERTARIGACLADLARSRDLDLGDPEDATRWIQVLNDLRLALGTRLGITEDDAEVDLDDPEQQPRVLYHWLTAVQDMVVTRLMR